MNQYEIEHVATEQWASRETCKVNIHLKPGIWRDIKHAGIHQLAFSIAEALYAYYCMDAVDPDRRYRGKEMS